MGNVALFLLIGCLVALPVGAQRGGGDHDGGRGGGSHGSGGGKGGGFRGHGFGRGFDGHNGSFFGFEYYPYYSWPSIPNVGYSQYEYEHPTAGWGAARSVARVLGWAQR